MPKHLLTERAVRTAAPPAGKAETTLYDGGGLALRVRLGADRRPQRAWQFWYERDGRRQKIGLGGYPEVPLPAAREKADRYRELLRAGITPTGAVGVATEGRPLVPRTLDDLMDRWEADQLARDHKDKGAAMRAAYRRHVQAHIGRVRLLDLRKVHVLHVVQPLAAAGKGRTAKFTLALLRQMARWAIGREWLAADPTAGLRKDEFGGRETPRDRVLSEDELRTLAARLQASRRAGPAGRERDVPVLALPTQAAVWVMLGTLARVGELCAARWEHVDFDAGTWLIPAEHSKNGQAHLIHLSGFALRHLRHLRAYAAGSAFVMPSRDGKAGLDPRTVTKQLGDRQHAAPLRGRSTQASALRLPGGPFTSHDLRRTGATMMRAAGVDVAIVERCLNHVESNRMVATYQRADLLPERRAAFESLGARLDALVPASATAHLEPGRGR